MTEDDAREILADVEPRHAHEERQNARAFAPRGGDRIDLRPHARDAPRGQIVARSVWRPRATRTPSGWAISGGWLDEPVPPLPTRGVPNAGGVRPVIAWSDDDGVREVVRDRCPGVLWATHVATVAPKTLYDTAVDRLYEPRALGPAIELPGEVCVSRKSWHRERDATRGYPTIDLARGWCPNIGTMLEETQPGTKAGWSVMVRALRAFMRETDAAWAAERAELTQRTEAA